jgi:hypothetical protein
MLLSRSANRLNIVHRSRPGAYHPPQTKIKKAARSYRTAPENREALKLELETGLDWSAVISYSARKTRAQLAAITNPNRAGRFLEEIAATPVPWLVDGILTRSGIAVCYGAPNVGKSFVMLDLAMAACGYAQTFMGRTAASCSSLYVTNEGLADFGLRCNAAWRHRWTHECGEFADFMHLGRPIDLRDKESVEAIVQAAKELSIATDEPCALIVLGTLADATPGLDENSGKEMGVVLSNVARIARQTSALVLIVHHSGKASPGLRGHTSLLAKADTVLKVADGRVTIEKARYGAKGLCVSFRLVPAGDTRVVVWDKDEPQGTFVATTAFVIEKIIEAEPGIKQSDVVARAESEASIYRKKTLAAIADLEKTGKIRSEREGKGKPVRYYPSPGSSAEAVTGDR